MKRRLRGPCYYCGAPGCTREHVPPKLMFSGFVCDSITVPSCDGHNTAKSGDDQAIVAAFLIALRESLKQNRLSERSLEADVIKAIQVAESSFERAKRRTTSISVVSDLPDIGYLASSVDIFAWIRQLTAALVYDGVHAFDSTIRWNEAIVYSPTWIKAGNPSSFRFDQLVSGLELSANLQKSLEQFDWHRGWSASPRRYPSTIYVFDLHFEPQEVVFRHTFYNLHIWYMRFSASQGTLAGLRSKTSSEGA